jgi:hypothetical protein
LTQRQAYQERGARGLQRPGNRMNC